MPIKSMGPVTVKNIRVLISTLQKDKRLRKEAIAEIRKNLYAFAERVFDLSTDQKKDLRRRIPQPMADQMAQSCATALENDGKITFNDLRPGRRRILMRLKNEYEIQIDPTTGKPVFV